MAESEVQVDVLIVMLAYILFTVVGVFGNTSIVIATCTDRRLQRNCNIFIALCSFGDVIHQLAHIPLAYHIFSGRPFALFSSCLAIQLVPSFMMNFAMFLALTIGIDRLLSVCAPFSYKHANRCVYLTFMIAMACLYAFALLVVAARHATSEANLREEVVCLIAVVYSGKAKRVWAISGCLLNVAIITVYVTVWILIRRKTGACRCKRLIKSLTIVTVFVIFGWFATMTSIAFTMFFQLSRYDEFRSIFYSGLFVNASLVCNYFIYFEFSHEYRRALKKHLIFLCGTSHSQSNGNRIKINRTSIEKVAEVVRSSTEKAIDMRTLPNGENEPLNASDETL